jgi:hypothetical protein
VTATAFVFTDVDVTVNSVDLSAWCTSATLTINVDEQETTAFGSTFKSRIGGLKDWKLDLEFNADFGASAIDQTIYPLIGTNTAITIKKASSANSTTNPQYSGSVLVAGYVPIDGGVGDLAKTKVSWNGSGALARATT